MLVPFLLGSRDLRAGLSTYEPVTAVLARATMLQDVLGVPNAINVLWSLSYEMLFYLLIVAAVVAGGLLPMAALTRTAGVWQVVTLTALVMAAAIGCAMSARGVLRTAGAVAGGVLALVLVLVNGRIGAWEGLVILAVMFTGTALYRVVFGLFGGCVVVLWAGFVLFGAF